MPNEKIRQKRKSKYPEVENVIKRLKEYYKVDTDKDLAEILKISPSTLRSWDTRGIIDYQKVFLACQELNRNYVVDGELPILKEDLFNLLLEMDYKEAENGELFKQLQEARLRLESGYLSIEQVNELHQLRDKVQLLQEENSRLLNRESVLKEIIYEAINNNKQI